VRSQRQRLPKRSQRARQALKHQQIRPLIKTYRQTTRPPKVVIDFTDEDGSTYRVPPALREVAEKGKSFTTKMQRLAESQAQADDRADYLQAREAVMAEVMTDVGHLRALQSEHAKYASLDWQALYNADPGQALKLRDQRDQLEKQMTQAQGQIQQKAQRVEKIAADHSGYQWDYAVKGAVERIGKVTPQEDAAMLRQAQSLGFTEKELRGRFADAKVLHAIYKAAKWDALQAGKPTALTAVTKAPPVIKPGATKGVAVAAEQRYKEARQALKKSGSMQDAARLFRMR
jgi:hypothetical protein